MSDDSLEFLRREGIILLYGVRAVTMKVFRREMQLQLEEKFRLKMSV